MTGITKPDGSVTSIVYDNMQRITSAVERTASGAVISGYEYIYDDNSRIVEEKNLGTSTKLCYTYDNLGRVVTKIIKNLSDNSVVSTEAFTYDAAGNITDAPDSCFRYDTNNRLVIFNRNDVIYDLDGNMLHNGMRSFAYDSANRLVIASDHLYTYNAENVRIRSYTSYKDTKYTYNTNSKLSQLLVKTTNNVDTKYVYGRGLIGQETGGVFKTYHFDSRGSTVAVTSESGNVTDTFAYDTYGKQISRTGTSDIIFGYNGKYGVVTDNNGLIYMRARYYSPDMKRFLNADIIAGSITNAVTLNRYAYANGNPVSFVDPFGLSAERGYQPTVEEAAQLAAHIYDADIVKDGVISFKRLNAEEWQLIDIISNNEGLKIGVYAKKYGNDLSYVLVNKGSETKSDWINNFQQPFGVSDDMKDSIAAAKKFVTEHPDAHITFVGHSKGGGEALANAKATNKDAIVFNPAIPNYKRYGLNNVYTAKATSYVVVGEILSSAYIAAESIALDPHVPTTPYLNDDGIGILSRFMFQSKPFWETKLIINKGWNPIKAHKMEQVIDALSEE